MPEEKLLERPRSVEGFQKMFRYIYYEVNERKYKKDDELIDRLMEEIACLTEYARKDRRAAFIRKTADIFSWHMGVCNRLGVDIQEALWRKYPGVCPYCLKEKDCICGTEHPKIADAELKLRRLRRERRGREPKTLAGHQALHRRLYSWQHDCELPIIIVAHMVEEIGEVSYAHRHFVMAEDTVQKNRFWDNVCEELTDVLSWMFALANRLEFDLADTVWEYYPYECADCHEGPCICKRTP